MEPRPIDWQATLTAECGFHAAQRLQRRVTRIATTSERASILDGISREPARDPAHLFVPERRRAASPSS
jgi:hypothetical protein